MTKMQLTWLQINDTTLSFNDDCLSYGNPVKLKNDSQGEKFVLNVYPNPSYGEFYVRMDSNEEPDNLYSCMVVSSTGKVIYEDNILPISSIIDISDNAAGVYALIVSDMFGNTYHKKILLIND